MNEFNPWEGFVKSAGMVSSIADAQERRRGARIQNDAAEIDLQQKQALAPMAQRAMTEDITNRFDANAVKRIENLHTASRYVQGNPTLAEEVSSRMGVDPQILMNIKAVSPDISTYDMGDGNTVVVARGDDGKMKILKTTDPAMAFNYNLKSQLQQEKAGFDMEKAQAMIAGQLAGIRLRDELGAERDRKDALSVEEEETLREGLRGGRLTAKQLRGLKPGDKRLMAQAMMDDPNFNPLREEEESNLRKGSATYKDYVAIQTIPNVLDKLEKAGKELNYPDAKFAGMLDKWKMGQLNDPALVRYMNIRNDLILALGRALRGGAATEFATKLEEEASSQVMSPKALESYVRTQKEILAPRVAEYERLYKRGAQPTQAPPIPGGAVTPEATPAQDIPMTSLSVGEQRAIRALPKWADAKRGEYVTVTNKARGTIRIKKED